MVELIVHNYVLLNRLKRPKLNAKGGRNLPTLSKTINIIAQTQICKFKHLWDEITFHIYLLLNCLKRLKIDAKRGSKLPSILKINP